MNRLPILTFLFLLAGCYPTLSEQDASDVQGLVFDSGKPLVGAQIALGEGLGGWCVDSPVFSNSEGSQPQLLGDSLRLRHPIVAVTDQDGVFHIPGSTSPGLATIRKEAIQRIHVCIVVGGQFLYSGRAYLNMGWERCAFVEINCDISKEEVCFGYPKGADYRYC